MLFSLELTNQVIFEQGNQLYPLPELLLPYEAIDKNCFIPRIKQFSRQRPVEKLMYFQLSDQLTGLPFKNPKVLDLYPSAMGLWEGMQPINPIKRMYWRQEGNAVSVAISGNYRVRFTHWIEPKKKVKDFPCELGPAYLEQELPSTVSNHSLEIHCLESELPLVIKENKDGKLILNEEEVGTVVEVEQLHNSKIVLNEWLPEPWKTENMKIQYSSTTSYVEELDYDNTEFIDMFKVSLLLSFGGVKSNVSMDGGNSNPFSLDKDQLLDRARQLEDKLEEKLEHSKKWWLS